jgi:4-amino-4-deoxy-L-arabinose transferase
MVQDKQFVNYFILKHTVQRVANAETFGRSKPWWFYLVLVPVLSLPWSAVLLANYKRIKLLQRRYVRLFLIWIFVPLVFFSLSSSKLILYVLPLFAGIALLAGYLLHNTESIQLRKTTIFLLLFYGVLAIAFILIPYLPVKISLPAWTAIFPLVMLSGMISIWRETVPEHKKIISAALLFSFLLIPFSTFLLAENPELTKSGKPIADYIQAEKLQNRPVVVYDELLPSLAFHLGKEIVSVYENDKNLIRETQFETDENWRQHYLDMHRPEDENRLRLLLKQNAVLVIKGEVPVEKNWLIRNFQRKKQFGKWYLYY